MKTNCSPQARVRGSVLIITMAVITVAVIVLASFFMLVQNQTASVARSQIWNTALPVSEAGIEDGMALINKDFPTINNISPWAWTNTATADGWSAFSGGQTTITRQLYGSDYYSTTVDISSGNPVITSVGFVPYTTAPWVYSAAGTPFLAAIGTPAPAPTSGIMGRKVQIQAALKPLFTAAIITKSNFNMNGNNTTVDSFDSGNALYSTLGQYDALKRKAGGDVATDSSIIGDIGVGNGNIYGHVYTGPGTLQSSVQVGSSGAVGDAAWNTTQNGVQPGYWAGDFNSNIQDVNAPATGTTALPAAVGGVVTLNGGNYTINPADPNLSYPLNITGHTTLWVQGSYNPPGVSIASTNGAALVLYVGRATGTGDSTTLGSGQAINQPGYAANLQFYGLPSLTSISMHGNAGVTAVIFAPEADAVFGGGGTGVTDTVGSMIVKSLKLNGHWNFHFDETLRGNPPYSGWIAKYWTELKYP